jgi:hypothetical protein
VLAQDDHESAHGVFGGLARFQIGYFQFGGTLEQTDRVIESWRSYGGFIGAFLPFQQWVDVECTLGGALRRHKNPEPRFGPGGYSLDMPALSLAVGISDRSSEGRFGVRLGARLVAAMDLQRKDAGWKYQIVAADTSQFVSGASKVGGFSMGAMVTAGFDVAQSARRVPSRR